MRLLLLVMMGLSGCATQAHFDQLKELALKTSENQKKVIEAVNITNALADKAFKETFKKQIADCVAKKQILSLETMGCVEKKE